jgi:hypothetical protein
MTSLMEGAGQTASLGIQDSQNDCTCKQNKSLNTYTYTELVLAILLLTL